MDLLPLFKTIEKFPVSVGIRESTWLFTTDQALHLVALTVLSGAILVVDLRLLGLGFSRQPVAQVARDARPWLIGALLAMVLTGIPQLMSNAIKEYYSPYFWAKMGFLLAAVVFTFTVRWKVSGMTEGRVPAVLRGLVGLVSIALWLSVAVSGRLIGLLS